MTRPKIGKAPEKEELHLYLEVIFNGAYCVLSCFASTQKRMYVLTAFSSRYLNVLYCISGVLVRYQRISGDRYQRNS